MSFFDKANNKIQEYLSKFYSYLKKKLNKFIYDFLKPYMDLSKRLIKGAFKGMKEEYLAWKQEKLDEQLTYIESQFE